MYRVIRQADLALRHPLRVALLDLLAAVGSLTANEAARRLGESSGACSFHLRQLARYGYVEPVAGTHGRARPWRLRPTTPAATPAADPGFGPLARELEDEGYRRWLARRTTAPEEWRRDEAFSEILHLTPEEMTRVADEIRAILVRFPSDRHRPGAAPVGVVARVFPLLPEEER